MTMWYGLFTPAGVPKAVTERLAAVTRKIMTSKEMVDWIHSAGADPLVSTPEEFSSRLHKETAYWQGVAKAIPKLVQKQ